MTYVFKGNVKIIEINMVKFNFNGQYQFQIGLKQWVSLQIKSIDINTMSF